ncbi:winged helix-turn-helix domain-containing protein [Croceicoccus sp. BE223]|uniref:winged helix-turn-helix domain-containing protein n=1 Tax=Croceicoccus sp. BE223 TaxID=2817716 RepID=UPI002863F589|nr:winged helix-turn-helix domain-containing protein [Croceicoccus sp. BE223]MDR7102820.1 hypothetical protein [Croceicoccus sp. BE223]
MSTEIQPGGPYAAVLADLRAKRDEIDKTIKFLEGMSGVKIASSTGHALAASSAHAVGATIEDSATLDEGAFHGMSIVDATKKLLAMRKRKMGNPEIARELAAGGLVMTSADPVNTVGSVLTRRYNQVGDVVKVARGTWGLKEWYPNRTFKPISKAPQIDAPKPGVSDGGEPDSACSGGGELDDIIG